MTNKLLPFWLFLILDITMLASPQHARAQEEIEPNEGGPQGPAATWHCALNNKTFPTEDDCYAGCSTAAGTIGTCLQVAPTLLPSAPSVRVPATSKPVEFVPLTGLPGLTDNQSRSLADYLNILFRLSIGIGALAGVIKITLAGIKYMSSDAFSSKEEAKKDITGALLGLLIMLSTVVILQFIYPGILNLNVLQQLPPIKTANTDPPGAGKLLSSLSLRTDEDGKYSPEDEKRKSDFIEDCKGKGELEVSQDYDTSVNTSFNPITYFSPKLLGEVLKCREKPLQPPFKKVPTPTAAPRVQYLANEGREPVFTAIYYALTDEGMKAFEKECAEVGGGGKTVTYLHERQQYITCHKPKSVPPQEIIPEGAACTATSKCAAGGSCYKNTVQCIKAYNVEAGTCMAACTPSAKKAAGESCEASAECQTDLFCKVKTDNPPSCKTATPATGSGQCFDANCRIP